MSDTNSGFQFHLSSVLLLTTVSAAILALLRPLQLPALVYFGFAAYAIVLSGYLVLRGFFLFRRYFQLRKRARDTRRELSDWVDDRRRAIPQPRDPEDATPTSNEPERPL